MSGPKLPDLSVPGEEDDTLALERPRKAPLPIVIACADGAVDSIDEAALALRERGHPVEIIGGAQEDPEKLRAAAHSFEREGLYVLCRGDGLERDAIDALRQVLREVEVPFGRTLTLALGSGGPRALEQRIVSVARRMVTGRLPRLPEAPSVSRPAQAKQAVLPVTDASAVDTRTLSSSPLGRDHPAVGQTEVDRWADSLAGGPRVEAPDAPAQEVDDTAASVAAFEPALADYSGVEHTQVSHNVQLPAEQPAPESPSGLPAESPPGLPDGTPVEAGSADHMGHATTPDEDDLDASAFRPGGRMPLYVGGGVIAVLMIVLVAILASGNDEPEDAVEDSKTEVAHNDEAGPEGKSASDEGESKLAAAAVEKEPVEEAKPEQVADAEPKPEPEPEAKPEPEPEAKPEPEPEAKPEPVAEPEPEPVAEPEPEPEPSRRPFAAIQPETPSLDPGAPPTIVESRLVAQALNDRELRAWNVFLVSDETKDMNHAEAAEHCAGLEVATLDGWRLPTIGELNSLRLAKLLKKSVFWSDTAGDAFGDTRMVINARKGSISAVTTGWTGARAVCVRERP